MCTEEEGLANALSFPVCGCVITPALLSTPPLTDRGVPLCVSSSLDSARIDFSRGVVTLKR